KRAPIWRWLMFDDSSHQENPETDRERHYQHQQNSATDRMMRALMLAQNILIRRIIEHEPPPYGGPLPAVRLDSPETGLARHPAPAMHPLYTLDLRGSMTSITRMLRATNISAGRDLLLPDGRKPPVWSAFE